MHLAEARSFRQALRLEGEPIKLRAVRVLSVNGRDTSSLGTAEAVEVGAISLPVAPASAGSIRARLPAGLKVTISGQVYTLAKDATATGGQEITLELNEQLLAPIPAGTEITVAEHVDHEVRAIVGEAKTDTRGPNDTARFEGVRQGVEILRADLPVDELLVDYDQIARADGSLLGAIAGFHNSSDTVWHPYCGRGGLR